MQLYLAAIYTSSFGLKSRQYREIDTNAQALRRKAEHFLESYHFVGKGSYMDKMREDGTKIFLDSGAFSAFTQGVEIDIRRYSQFIRDNADVVDFASVLDSIGNHEKTLTNQKILEDLGTPCLPCFHVGEPLELCQYYCDNYEYMTIGGMVPVPNAKLRPWLDMVWDQVLTDDNGIAKTKVHGFGLTTFDLMQRYPWFSTDSSSWVQSARTGSILFPDNNKAIPISERSPARKEFGQHYTTYPREAKDIVDALLTYYGLTHDQVAKDYRYRWALNIYTFSEVGRRFGEDHWRKPFKLEQPGLF